jgi:hypothetical protein
MFPDQEHGFFFIIKYKNFTSCPFIEFKILFHSFRIKSTTWIFSMFYVAILITEYHILN